MSILDKIVEIGSIITFGNYDWLVLDVKDNEALIIAEKIVCLSAYIWGEHGETIERGGRTYKLRLNDPGDTTWEYCDLRVYLNNKFLQTFTKEQQKRIIEKTIANPDNLWYGTKGGGKTRDKVFVLSLEEADRYFGDSGDYLNKRGGEHGYSIDNDHNEERVSRDMDGKTHGWWLRSPGKKTYCQNVAFVFSTGQINVEGSEIADASVADNSLYHTVLTELGVRPALWLKLES